MVFVDVAIHPLDVSTHVSSFHITTQIFKITKYCLSKLSYRRIQSIFIIPPVSYFKVSTSIKTFLE